MPQAYIGPNGVSNRVILITFFPIDFVGALPITDLKESLNPLRDSNPESNAALVTLSPDLILLNALFNLIILWYA